VEADAKQQQQSQYIALFLVVLGLAATYVGCHFYYTELTTAAVGVVGIGGGMLTNQHSNSTPRGDNNARGKAEAAPKLSA